MELGLHLAVNGLLPFHPVCRLEGDNSFAHFGVLLPDLIAAERGLNLCRVVLLRVELLPGKVASDEPLNFQNLDL